MSASSSHSGSQPPAHAAPDDLVARRRRMLRLVAGGVPLMTALPAGANSVAASSAWRAVRNDATQSPSAFATAPDGWIRQQVEIVNCVPIDPASTIATFKAFRIGVRYYRLPDLTLVDLAALGLKAGGVDGYGYALVLFNNEGQVLGIDPARTAGSGGLQGLHCSSWSSINAGATYPGCTSGFGV